MDAPLTIDATRVAAPSRWFMYGGETGRCWEFNSKDGASRFFWEFERRLSKQQVAAARFLYGCYPELVERMRVALRERPVETIVGYEVEVVRPDGAVERRGPNRFQYRWERANITLVICDRVHWRWRLTDSWYNEWLLSVMFWVYCKKSGTYSNNKPFATAMYEYDHPHNKENVYGIWSDLQLAENRREMWCVGVGWQTILEGLPRDYVDLLRGQLQVYDTPRPDLAAADSLVSVAGWQNGYILLSMTD